ncbi:dephospho-CoA kinase [Chroogloeocystis siderophila 5.2 s.c.1]|uniref:Dephospho-CoA kinase n=2 Tax=Chroogloeocystis TaxID=329162 RepID=A0A1U7HQX1_9CHRO|nr:dephospho-CoA kinase [Chroogloeocystis siderophila 5.2 s.c.1]
MTHRRIIGLTGGIATGKSTVAHYLATHHHLPILDADIYAREAVAMGSPVYDAIAQRYGSDLFLNDGSLNRKQLGDIIFNNAEERTWLEQQIHPYVRDRFAEAMQQPYQTIVCVIPLLFEAGLTHLVTEIWVVVCSPQQQLARLMQRNQLTREQALARINSQMSLAEKASRADVVLDNSSTPEALLQQVDAALSSTIDLLQESQTPSD